MNRTPPSRGRVGVLAELAVAVALAAVLSLLRIKLPHLLYGGSVSLHLVPLFIVAARRGVRAGAIAGAAYGVINFLMTPYFVHPLQVLLDYPVAFGAVGVAGIARAGPPSRKRTVILVAGVLAGSAARLVAHFASGVVYFGYLAPKGTPVWAYSLGYNASYVLPEAILCAVLVPAILSRLGMPAADGAVPRRPAGPAGSGPTACGAMANKRSEP